MKETSLTTLSVRRFLFGFVVGGVVISGIGFAIRGEHMADGGTFLIGLGIAFVFAVSWVVIGVTMHGVTRPGKDD